MKFFILFTILVCVQGEQVRQCTCDQLDSCKESVIEKISPCVTECKEKTTNTTESTVDPETIFNCIKQFKEERNSCFRVLKSEICTSNPDTMIDSSDTFDGTNKKIIGRILQNRAQKALSEGTSTISQLISKSLGVNAAAFGECMKTCVKDTNPLQCIKDLGCGLKKPSTFNLLNTLPACKGGKQLAKEKICQCIKDAGYSNAQC